MRRFAGVLSIALLLLSGCATTQRLSAAGDVHALLIAIRDDDRAAFDAHVDRPALDGQIQSLMMDRAHRARDGGAVAALGALLSGPLSRVAGDAVIRPDVFRAVAEYYGYRPDTRIPGAFALSTVLAPIGEGRVCARDRKDGRCLMTFANEDGTWRLVAVDTGKLAGLRRDGGGS